MKEIIYLDMELVNSYLAQMDEGILTKIIIGKGTQNSSQKETGTEEIKNVNAGINTGLFKSGGDIGEKNTDKSQTVYSRSNTDLIETALNDYSLDVLIEKLTESKSFSKKAEDGQIINDCGKLHSFNFSQLKKITSRESLNYVFPEDDALTNLKRELNKVEKNNVKTDQQKTRRDQLREEIRKIDSYGNLFNMSSYIDMLFPNSTLFKINNSLLLCSNESLRINAPTLSMLASTNRQCRVLGIVISKKEKETLVPDEGVQLPSDKIASDVPSILVDIMLTNFDIASVGDSYVRPFAIYYT